VLARLGGKLAREVVAVADRVRQDYGIEPCSVIHNGVTSSPAEDGREAAPPSAPGDGAGLHLIFAGRVTETKGIFVLLQALARASSRAGRIRLTAYGSIDQLERYEEAKRSLGIQDIVEDRGFREDSLQRDGRVPVTEVSLRVSINRDDFPGRSRRAGLDDAPEQEGNQRAARGQGRIRGSVTDENEGRRRGPPPRSPCVQFAVRKDDAVLGEGVSSSELAQRQGESHLASHARGDRG